MIKTVVSTALPVDERLLIKKNIISHGDSSKRICVVTGTHGDELEGQYVCFRLNQIVQQNLDKLNGTLEIYPALNPLGIDSITRGIPGFDLDMNRIFPGNPEGTMAEQVACTLIHDLQGADMVIDIHSSNIFYVRFHKYASMYGRRINWFLMPGCWMWISFGYTKQLRYWRPHWPIR